MADMDDIPTTSLGEGDEGALGCSPCCSNAVLVRRLVKWLVRL
jgi:hypothetical protein